jgi:hypothetical protein
MRSVLHVADNKLQVAGRPPAARPGATTRVRSLVFGFVWHRNPQVPRTWLQVGALVLRLAGVGLVVAMGAIHLHLWSQGYRELPKIGVLFLADAVAAFVVAFVLLIWPTRLVGIVNAGLAASTLGGLVISINVSLFNFKESSSGSYVVSSLVLEAVATVVLLAWVVLDDHIEHRADLTSLAQSQAKP